MPSTSLAQHFAMEAAKQGRSRLGIPKRVGAEYVEADKRAGKYQGQRPKAQRKAR